MRKRFAAVYYKVANHKNSGTFRIAFISDLHNNCFGRNQSELVKAVRHSRPDVVLFGGDIADDHRQSPGAYRLIAGLADLPCFYVSGNHEHRTGDLDGIKRKIRSLGAEVLEGDWRTITIRGCSVVIGGTDDPEKDTEDFYRQLMQLEAAPVEQSFSILLEHRPEKIKEYLPLGFDLMLAGHAHGGQWRIPGVVNGVFAPHQGIFPRYAGGRYEFEEQTMIVGRGLEGAAYIVPRIFNPRELVIIDVEADA